MASGRQFQSIIVFGKTEILKTSLFVYYLHATLGVLNIVFSGIYINRTMSKFIHKH